MIKAGDLNRKIEIYRIKEHLDSDGKVILDEAGQPVEVDQAGQPKKTLEFLSFAWASVRPVRGYEKMQHGREEMATMQYTFKIRFNNLKASDLLKLDDAFWEIQSMAPMGRLNREIIEVLAEQIDVRKIVNE